VRPLSISWWLNHAIVDHWFRPLYRTCSALTLCLWFSLFISIKCSTSRRCCNKIWTPKCSSENYFAVDDNVHNVYMWLSTMEVSHLKKMMSCELVSSEDCVMRTQRWTQMREMTKVHLCQSVTDFSQWWSFLCGSLWPVFYGVFFSTKAIVYPKLSW